MSTQAIMTVAILVFVLMGIGLVLTMREFSQLSDEPTATDRPGQRRGYNS